MDDLVKRADDHLDLEKNHEADLIPVGTLLLVRHMRVRIKASQARIAELEAALREIARPKIGPDFSWSDDEANRWRAAWYQKYQEIARAALEGEK